MKKHDGFDRKLRRRFSETRRAESAAAPGFDAVLRRSRTVRSVAPGRRIAIFSAAGSLATVAAAAWLWGTGPAHVPAGTDFAVPAGPSSPDTVAARQSMVLDSRPAPVVERSPAAESDIVNLDRPEPQTKFTDEFVQDLSDPGRFYRNVPAIRSGGQDMDGEGNPNVHGSRTRDFQMTVSGVSNVDPLTGGDSNEVNPNSIEEVEVAAAADAIPRYRPRRGFAPIVQVPDADVIDAGFNTESYAAIEENDSLAVVDHPLSTFSIDVDTASYANVRRFLRGGALPPPGAVRIEEMINYFDYDYPAPSGPEPFSVTVEVADCPWAPDHRLARVGIKGREVDRGQFAGTNLVFLIDVSGSMNAPQKLPLLKQALSLLVDRLDGRDRVAIVVYAGASGLVLPPTPGSARAEILEAIARLGAGGGTNGGSGLRLAYEVARENFIPGGVNRVILATDGDFNVGLTDRESLLRAVRKDARKGIFLTALGFGMGNYKDDTLELLADKGNGNYAYIDSLREARKVLVEEIGGTLVTIAKDVKIQVEFNPAEVGAYRLIGYENRVLRKEDFNDDRKDAGEIGAGHSVTALYELIPPGERLARTAVDPLKYQTPATVSDRAAVGELMTIKVRYKDPDGQTSRLSEFPVIDDGLGLAAADEDLRFAAAVAAFGGILQRSKQFGEMTLEDVRVLAVQGIGADVGGHRSEFVDLVSLAEALPRADRSR